MDNLSTLLDMLAVKEERLLELDFAMEQLTPLDDLENEVEDYKQRVISFKNCAKRMIKRREAHQRVSDASSVNSFSTRHRQSVKLPKLVIDKYNGDVSKWQEFLEPV